MLERLGLADRSGDDIKRLSGGLAQRVQLAAAMVHGPQLLALDEPFAGLDPAGVAFLSQLALDHVAAGGNLLLSSHQLDVVEDLCDDIVLVQRGRSCCKVSTSTSCSEPRTLFLRVDGEVEAAWLDGTERQHIAERTPGRRGCACTLAATPVPCSTGCGRTGPCTIGGGGTHALPSSSWRPPVRAGTSAATVVTVAAPGTVSATTRAGVAGGRATREAAATWLVAVRGARGRPPQGAVAHQRPRSWRRRRCRCCCPT
ncbi:MAG: ATP-binding cassette domain-containing protein [Acidimicrobiales bacterium]